MFVGAYDILAFNNTRGVFMELMNNFKQRPVKCICPTSGPTEDDFYIISIGYDSIAMTIWAVTRENLSSGFSKR